MILDNTCKRKDPPTLFENDNGPISIEVLYKDDTLIPLSVDEVVDGSGATSSTEGDADQDHHWKRKKKKVKDQNSKFADLDTVTIDSETFFVGDSRSTMPLLELADQLGFEGASTDMFNGIFYEDGATSPSFLEISSPPCHPTSLIKGTDAFDTSALEGSVNVFFETFEEYDVMKSSSSQRMTRECHQKLLLDVQQCHIDAKKESKKANGHIEDLQATLAKINKELKTLYAKRKKTLACIDEQREQLSKGQEKIIGFESEIRAFEENRPLSEDEVKKFFKIK
ncbi:hypothetical protein HAX54_040190 [Datura stramonium]|uniref:Uncharacterized protein n=1 Tax=Datura stramonium TaxID=4076 RepID=A0ABS8VQE8_DATST|nr:hypothetical protein [Datura stramonium]